MSLAECLYTVESDFTYAIAKRLIKPSKNIYTVLDMRTDSLAPNVQCNMFTASYPEEFITEIEHPVLSNNRKNNGHS